MAAKLDVYGKPVAFYEVLPPNAETSPNPTSWVLRALVPAFAAEIQREFPWRDEGWCSFGPGEAGRISCEQQAAWIVGQMMRRTNV